MILKIHGAVDRADASRRQLRDHRGPLHRVPRAARDISNLVPVTLARDATEPLPLPRLQPARLEPARDPPPHLGRAAVAVSSRRGRSSATRSSSRSCSGASAASRSWTSTSTTTSSALRASSRTCPRAAAAARASTPSASGHAPVQGPDVPYSEEDAAFFFGRDEWRDIIVDNLMASPADAALRRRAASARPRCCGRRRARPARGARGTSRHRSRRAHRRRLRAGSERPAAGARGIAGRGRGRLRRAAPDARARPPRRALDERSRAGRARRRPVCVILDQFEEYFLYHPRTTATGRSPTSSPRAVERRGPAARAS